MFFTQVKYQKWRTRNSVNEKKWFQFVKIPTKYSYIWKLSAVEMKLQHIFVYIRKHFILKHCFVKHCFKLTLHDFYNGGLG